MLKDTPSALESRPQWSTLHCCRGVCLAKAITQRQKIWVDSLYTATLSHNDFWFMKLLHTAKDCMPCASPTLAASGSLASLQLVWTTSIPSPDSVASYFIYLFRFIAWPFPQDHRATMANKLYGRESHSPLSICSLTTPWNLLSLAFTILSIFYTVPAHMPSSCNIISPSTQHITWARLRSICNVNSCW